jgi:quinol monooxygenase YgiN
MAGFVQIIDMTSSSFDEIDKLDREWHAATEGKRTLRHSVLARDRNNPNRYLVFAFFDSYEDAMKNSALPETSKFAEAMGAFLDGPPSFVDLDIIRTEN